MKVVVLRDRGSTLAVVFILIFMVAFMAPLVYMLLSAAGGTLFLVLFIAFALLIFGGGLYGVIRVRSASKRAEAFFSAAEFSDSAVSLPDEMDFEVGVLEMRGWWSGGKNRTYHVSREFTAERTSRGSRIPLAEGEFKAAIYSDGTGFVRTPAVRILSEPYRDVVLLFLTRKGRVNGEGTVTVSTQEDSAQVSFRGDGKLIRGSVYSTLTKARQVKVALTTEGFSFEKILGTGTSFEFSAPMLPEESTVLVGNYKTVSPRSLAGSLGGETLVMGHGGFIIRAILDIRLRPDVKAEEKFMVELGGKEAEKLEEREFEEKWGFT
ncbi:hypothetical protein FH039_00800 [Thermococcus indicus]|uniref:Uncharacterized protein n=1 Tax=Thermococcus indicus TaxID=2586643 RepID=A0A4Y5SMS8_9EURY|nr:hypothetical protein [Thermococcus indicus]QDA32208.1 hypothetical protein FH039_00800 [Thermococcus indicus]